jgi:probable rRNA maturation factor
LKNYLLFTNFEIMNSKSKVYFFFDGVNITLKNRRKLKTVIEKIFKKEKRLLKSLNYIFCRDEKLLAINKKYLSHNDYTDIITFELSEKGMPIEGEIYISVDRVRDNASLLDEVVSKELYRVIFHGALHLCGFKDKSKKEIRKMRDMEAKYLNDYL